MARKHDCEMPNTSAKKWKCPVCKRVWTWKADGDALTTLWHGRDNVRNADGSRLRWWQ